MNAKQISKRAVRKVPNRAGPRIGPVDHDEDIPAVVEFERDRMGIASKE